MADADGGRLVPSPAPVTFLYEDASMVVVDKPAGWPVVPAPGFPAEASLRHRVAAALGAPVWVVHRLDLDTSGVVVFARDAAAHRALSLAFEARAVVKTYGALVAGVPTPSAGAVDVPLHAARKGRTRPALAGEAGAREASTGYVVTRVWRHGERAVAALDALPQGGRHHQIRVHLRSIGTPILGDAVYGRAVRAVLADLAVPRLCLHARSIDLPHPQGGRRVVVTAPWPADLEPITAALDRTWTEETPA